MKTMLCYELRLCDGEQQIKDTSAEVMSLWSKKNGQKMPFRYDFSMVFTPILTP